MWQYALVSLAGCAAALAVAVRPARFWPVLISTTIVTSGMMINGYAIVDEILTGFILLGAFLPIAVHRLPLGRMSPLRPAHVTFVLFATYLLAAAVLGTVLLDDWRMLRWVVFYAMIGLLVFLVTHWHLPAPDSRRIARIVTAAGLTYIALYLAHGVLSEWLRGLSRWDLQGSEWAGSAYAMFPLAVIVPAAVLVLGADRRPARATALAVLLLVMVAAIYYDSRTTWLVLAAVLFLGALFLGLRRRVLIYGLGLVAFAVVLSAGWHVDLRAYVSSSWQSARAPVAPRESDIDRRLHIEAGLLASTRSVPAFIFGSGLYAHREVLSPYLSDLYGAYLPDVLPPQVSRTVGFSALLVDGGVIALALLGSVCVFAAWEVVRRSGSRARRVLLLGALLLIPLWTFVSNVQDIMLLYITLMPSGLLSQLAPPPSRNATQAR